MEQLQIMDVMELMEAIKSREGLILELKGGDNRKRGGRWL